MKQYYPSDWERRCSGGVYASLSGGCCRLEPPCPPTCAARASGSAALSSLSPHARPHGANRSPGDPRA